MPAARPAPVLSLLAALLRGGGAFVTSATLHATVLVAWYLASWITMPAWEDEEPAGEDGAAEVAGNAGGEVALGSDAPVSVTLIDLGDPLTDPAVALAQAVAAVEAARAAQAAQAAQAADDARAQAGAVTKGSSTGERTLAKPTARLEGARGGATRGDRDPCEAVEAISVAGPDSYVVEREFLDWYAKRPKEIGAQVGVTAHDGPDGRPDGARLYLPRCSVLRQAGFRHGDIVTGVNGRTVATVTAAVTTWFALRGEDAVTVAVTRKNGDRATLRFRLVP